MHFKKNKSLINMLFDYFKSDRGEANRKVNYGNMYGLLYDRLFLRDEEDGNFHRCDVKNFLEIGIGSVS